MELTDAIDLIRNDRIIKEQVTVWADLGSGNGMFTQALSYLLKAGSLIYAVDSSKSALSQMRPLPDGINVEKIRADFIQDVFAFHNLDGILLANALHYVSDKVSFFRKAEQWLQPAGCFLLVEYDTDRSNPWVPYPISFKTLGRLIGQLEYQGIEKLHERPSIYNKAPIYSAVVTL
ncbi:MAG TPA: methyltransferase domain-containing protein [Flavisolibacter sp.]|nr:methyltransferase domain-containing protein [Flavisolibacter sp.]